MNRRLRAAARVASGSPHRYNRGESVALQIGARLGPYEVLAQIGVGGMGEVYRARDRVLNREVALKVLPEVFLLDAREGDYA